MKQVVIVDGNSLDLKAIEAIAHHCPISLPDSIREGIERSNSFVKKIAQGEQPTYGINTGFGFFANKKINSNELKELQLNLLKSHAAGYGTPLTIPETRLAMVLRLNVLVKGYTGVRFELCEALFHLIKANIYPIIPEYGSVGASGDLAPLAHLALPLTGHGLVSYCGKLMPAADALKEENLEPITLDEKEGLGLINGTQVMLSVGGLALVEARKLVNKADQITALTYEGMNACLDALNPSIHELRGQKGQMISARCILEELKDSYLSEPNQQKLKVQDPYSLRCAPQIHGASRDAVSYACQIIEKELNAATDNPLVFVEQEKVLSGGNFHGQPLALAFDFAAMAMSEIGNVSDRRLELLMNPQHSGLPAFLTLKEGIHSGYMAFQYLSASLVNENKLLANPACTDSIPGNVGIEDHVSMGMTSARKLKRIVQNVRTILAIEMIAAAQAIDLRKVKRLGIGTKKTYETIRSVVPMLTADRIISEDLEQALKVLTFH